MIYEIKKSNWQNQVEKLKSEIDRATYITAITGAGISVDSGLPVVSENVCGIPLKKFFDREFWLASPEKYYDVYRSLYCEWRNALPNKAHHSLAQMDAWVITQNIDGLHRDAGSRHLLELHGNLRELRCDNCKAIFGSEIACTCKVPLCNTCGSILRPGISFEGEEVRHASLAFDWIGRTNVLLIVGTKLNMFPLNHAPHLAHERGITTIWINYAAELVLSELLTFSNKIV